MDNVLCGTLASVLPGFTKQEYLTISRALDLLNIDVSRSDKDFDSTPDAISEAKLAIAVCHDNQLSGHEEEHLYAYFDVDSLEWRLRRQSSTPTLSSPSPSSSPLFSGSRSRSRSPFSRSRTRERSRQDTLQRYGPSSQDIARLEDTVSLNDAPHSTSSAVNDGHDSPQCTEVEHGNLRGTGSENYADWTLQIARTAHNQFLLDTAWQETSLGPMSEWPLSLRLMTLKMLRDPRPANLYWGPDRVAIYNEPFSIMAASRHPAMMGVTAEVAMPATWPFLSVMMQQVEDSTTAFSLPEFEMEVHKASDLLEEAWYDGVFSPITDTNGKFLGLYNCGDEITSVVLSRRYGRLIHQITATPDFATFTPWQHIIQSCREFERDVPMLLVYSADMKVVTNGSGHCTLRLEGSLGLPEDSHDIPNSFDLSESIHPLAQAFNSCKSLQSPTLLDMPAGKLPAFLGGCRWRGWPEPSTHMAVMPLFTTGLIAGFMVMGLNPRRPYDDDLKQLVNDVWRSASSVIESSISFDQAVEREQTLTQELTQREKFIRKIAEVVTVGIYSLTDAGTLTYANARYHDIVNTTAGRENGHPIGFAHYILEDDLSKVTEAHDKCKSEQTSVSINVRLRETWKPPGSSTQQHRWVMNSVMPDVENGRLEGIIGSIADMSHTMWALQLQKDSTREALETKQHLERFIDMTSHEMRNPLGATIQCADDIIQSIDLAITKYQDADELHHFFEAIRENAKTITVCSTHQKSIADDILVASKLSSSLMALSPTVCQPELETKEVIQMFKAQAANESIGLSLTLDASYSITWAFCDAPRVKQILINLLTNAMKFTKGRPKRCIEVIMGACNVAPPPGLAELIWYPKDSPPPLDPNDDSETFFTIQVQDTGKGLSESEMSRLFNRFSQADSKTAITYGGSGLGLYISMQLAELQGGRIGLKSKQGLGSTFAFYIRVKKVAAETETAVRRASESHKNVSLKENLEFLLVEDNFVNQRVLKKQLSQKGHNVHIANHGLEALDYLKTTRYWRDNKGAGADVDIILMDWEMPTMNGIDCTKQIRELERTGAITDHLPIIVTSANSRVEQQEEAFAAGTVCLSVAPRPLRMNANTCTGQILVEAVSGKASARHGSATR